MRFDIITIFPHIFDSYFSESIIGRAQKNSLISVNVHDLRDYAEDKHKTTDDTPYGGGAGMVMKVEPIYKSVKSIKESIEPERSKTRVILFSAKGKKYTQSDAVRLSKIDNLILICGRYEGVDERVAEHIADEEISIGDYILTGGEIPSMILIDSIARLIPGVLGNANSLKEESFNMAVRHATDAQCSDEIKNFENIGEYPQYTKPEEFFAESEGISGKTGWKVPKILLSGNHKHIEEWREKNSKNLKPI